MGNIPYALQLYTVRDHVEKDIAGALKRVKEAGYDYVEALKPPKRPVEEYKQLLDEAGLTPVSCHFWHADVTHDIESVKATLTTLGIKDAVTSYNIPEGAEPEPAWKAFGEALAKASSELRSSGFALSYHNHAHEFQRIAGQYIFDLLLDMGASAGLNAEIDTYWAKFGGVDPVDVLQRYTGRCELVHIKDMEAEPPHTYAEVGKGIMDWDAILPAAHKAGAKWYIVEQDVCKRDSLECARTSAEFMAKQSV